MNVKKAFSVSVLSFLLSACGGGGGGGGGGDDRKEYPSSPAPSGVVVPKSEQPSAPVPGGSDTASAPKSEQPSAPVPGGSDTASAPKSEQPSAPVPGGSDTASVVPKSEQPSAPVPGGSDTASVVPKSEQPLIPSIDTGSEQPAPPVVTPPVHKASYYDGRSVISEQGEHELTNISSSEGRDIETDLVTLRVADNNATVTLKTQRLDRYPLEDRNVSIKDLKDTDGSLLGYYGTVRATSVEPSRDGTRGSQKYSLLNILYVVDENKARLPVNNNVQYAGTFQYVKAKDSTIRNGDAVFHYKDKQINGSIIDDRGRTSGHWIVDGDKTVNENGEFNIRLTSRVDAVASGEMQGGFYGSEGQVMAASAESLGASRDQDEWKGIFVGNQRPVPKS